MRVILSILLFFAIVPANAQAITATDVRTVQQLLKDEGYDTGAVDGSFGPRTSAAIKRYQADWQIRQTGKINPDLMDRLTGKHAATQPRWQTTDNQDCSVHNPFPRARESITFEGVCLDGKASGEGKLVYRYFAQGKERKESFEGALIDGKSAQQGIYLWSNGDRYEGSWRDGKSDGLGVYMWADGRSYAGYWQQDRAHGQGTYKDSEGKAFVGEFRNGCFYNDDTEIAINTDREDCSVE